MMKRTIIIALLFAFSISFCMAQSQINVKDQIELLEKRYQEAITSADKNFKQGQYAQAIKDYEKARDLKPANAETINAEIEKVKRKIAQVEAETREQRYRDAITSAEKNFEQKRYQQAREDYRKALDIKPEQTDLINPKLEEIDRILKEKAEEYEMLRRKHEYAEAVASAEQNLKDRNYAQAKQNYLKALELQPESADYIHSKIAELGKPSQLHVYRKRAILGIFDPSYSISLDDVIIGDSKNGWKTSAIVEDWGVRVVWAEIEGRKSEVRIDFEPGKTYYVRCKLKSETIKTGEFETVKKKNGTTERREKTKIQYTPILELVSASVGEREFKAIKSQ